jgi:two-component system, chemotaxis family, CheB/CheR fusion protein
MSIGVSDMSSDDLAFSVARQLPHNLLDVLPAAIYTTDEAGRITYYNQSAAELWGHSPRLGEATFCGSWKLYHMDGTPMAHDECPMAVALKSGLPIRGMEAIAERPDGTRVPFVPYPTPLHDADGRLAGAVNMLVDVSDRKRAERDARWLAAIVESSDDAIVSKDLDGFVTSWNAGAERTFGYTADEMIGKSIVVLIPAERHDEKPRILDRIRRGERVDHYETVRLRKDGTLIDISLTVSPIRDGAGRVVGASKIARDITERKQAQARQDLLSREVHHRTKNLFAVVQAIVSRSFVGKSTVKEAEAAVLGRLQSLAQTHELLVAKDWQFADLREIVASEMAPYKERVRIDGPGVVLSPQAAQNFALTVHELATNAAKYGGLSNATGQVSISWRVLDPDGQGQFEFRWEEIGGPPVGQPARKGFGSVILEQVMAQYFGAKPAMRFCAQGVRYELAGSFEAIAG